MEFTQIVPYLLFLIIVLVIYLSLKANRENFTNSLCYHDAWLDACKKEILHVLRFRPELVPNLSTSKILSVVGCRNDTYDDRGLELIVEIGMERYHAEFTTLNGRPQLLRFGPNKYSMANLYTN